MDTEHSAIYHENFAENYLALKYAFIILNNLGHGKEFLQWRERLLQIVFTTLNKVAQFLLFPSDTQWRRKNLKTDCLLPEWNTLTRHLLLEAKLEYFFTVYTWLKQVSRSHLVLSNAHISLWFWCHFLLCNYAEVLVMWEAMRKNSCLAHMVAYLKVGESK